MVNRRQIHSEVPDIKRKFCQSSQIDSILCYILSTYSKPTGYKTSTSCTPIDHISILHHYIRFYNIEYQSRTKLCNWFLALQLCFVVALLCHFLSNISCVSNLLYLVPTLFYSSVSYLSRSIFSFPSRSFAFSHFCTFLL